MSTRHWTNESTKAFRIRIVSDFTLQIQKRLDELGLSHISFAKRLGLDKSRISQFLNTPGNFTVDSMIEWARALEMKVSIVAYDDGDHENVRGPINAAVFAGCWASSGKPTNMKRLAEAVTAQKQFYLPIHNVVVAQPEEFKIGDFTWQNQSKSSSNTPNLQKSWCVTKELQKATGDCSLSLASGLVM